MKVHPTAVFGFLVFFYLTGMGFALVEEKFPYPEFGDGQPALLVPLGLVDGIAVDDQNIYFSDRSNHLIRKINHQGIITTIAGNGIADFRGDGGPALQASLNCPAGLVLDSQGNIYVADRNNHRVRKISRNGIITTVAGNGIGDYSGDDGPALEASLNLPSDVAVDREGNLFISDRSNNRIRKVDPQGTITTYAGLGPAWYGGDYDLALDAYLKFPFGIALDGNGNLYIADRGNNRIRKVNSDGIITTVAGDGLFASRGDRGPATRANLAYPTDVAVDTSGNYYIADRNNSLVRKVTPLGIISQIVGTGVTHFNGDQGLAPETNLHLPFAVALSADEKYLYIVDRNHFRIRKLEFATQRITTVAGNGHRFKEENPGKALGALLNGPWGLEIDKSGNLIVADQSNHILRKVTPEGFIFNFAGNGKPGESGDGKPAKAATLHKPTILVYDPHQNLYVAVRSGNGWRIRKINPQGQISWFAGNSKVGTEGDGEPAKNASFYVIADMAADSAGNLYIADRANPFVRKIDRNGIITRIGGTDWAKLEGDIHPNGIELDAKNNIYVSDSGSSRIWKINSHGGVSRFAGNGDFEDHGDGGPALKAGIRSPGDLKFSPSGELYVAEERGHYIRKIDSQGIIHRVAGTGVAGFGGDGGPALQAQINGPTSMVFDQQGNLYFTDRVNGRIRKVDAQGIISTVAGKEHGGYLEEGLEINLIIHNFP